MSNSQKGLPNAKSEEAPPKHNGGGRAHPNAELEEMLPGSPRTIPPCRMRVGPGPTPMRNRRSPTPRSPYTRGSPQPSPMPRRRNAIREKGRPRRKGSKWMEEEHFGLSALGLSGPPQVTLAIQYVVGRPTGGAPNIWIHMFLSCLKYMVWHLTNNMAWHEMF